MELSKCMSNCPTTTKWVRVKFAPPIVASAGLLYHYCVLSKPPSAVEMHTNKVMTVEHVYLRLLMMSRSRDEIWSDSSEEEDGHDPFWYTSASLKVMCDLPPGWIRVPTSSLHMPTATVTVPHLSSEQFPVRHDSNVPSCLQSFLRRVEEKVQLPSRVTA